MRTFGFGARFIVLPGSSSEPIWDQEGPRVVDMPPFGFVIPTPRRAQKHAAGAGFRADGSSSSNRSGFQSWTTSLILDFRSAR